MIKAVIFDFCQTLVDSADGFRAAEKHIQGKLLAGLANVEWQEFIDCYRKLRREFREGLRFSRADMWQAVCERFGRQVARGELEQWEVDYWQQVTAMATPFPDAADALTALASRYKLALLSNTETTGQAARQQMEQFPQITKHMSAVVLAGKDGVPAKPDEAAFAECLARLAVTPDEAVFVGDDWRIDICGAQAAGVRPVWLQHSSSPRNYPDVATDVPIITALAPLPDLLTRLDGQ